MTLLAKLTQQGLTPEITRPAPDRLISGDPVHSTWSLDERDGLYCGIWQSTVGAWQVHYTEWEYFNILSGHSVLTDATGTITHLHAGDRFVIRPGFVGTWQVIETTIKDYVIRL
jgi:uncharacterized protein